MRGAAVERPHANLGFVSLGPGARPCWDAGTMLWPPDGR